MSAVGLRAYYDAAARPSRFGVTVSPAAPADEYFHSNGNACTSAASTGVTSKTTDGAAPTAALTAAKCRDSAAVKFSGGNLWQVVDTWTLPATL